jgi:hypothetical membrane protein
MERVPRKRITAGVLAWVLTLQFFVVEAIAITRRRAQLPYSRSAEVISALGDSVSPGAPLMNASFVVQAALIGAGAVLLLPALRGRAARPAVALLGAAALGVLLVGVFPRTSELAALHTTGAALYLVGGGLGLIAVAYAVRPWSEALGTTLVLLGLFGTAMTVFYGAGVVGFLGEGGTERAAAYVLPIGLALAGPALWWLTGNRDEPRPGGPTRRQLRARAKEEERLARARRSAERDEALEAAARRTGTHSSVHDQPVQDAVDDLDLDHDDLDDLDPDDPWAGPRRRRGR